jgi:hypothetical protein
VKKILLLLFVIALPALGQAQVIGRYDDQFREQAIQQLTREFVMARAIQRDQLPLKGFNSGYDWTDNWFFVNPLASEHVNAKRKYNQKNHGGGFMYEDTPHSFTYFAYMVNSVNGDTFALCRGKEYEFTSLFGGTLYWGGSACFVAYERPNQMLYAPFTVPHLTWESRERETGKKWKVNLSVLANPADGLGDLFKRPVFLLQVMKQMERGPF